MSHILADTTAMVARAALPPTSAFVTLDSTWGAYLLGTCVSLVLYGVSLHQFYRYIRMYPTDTSFIRFIVLAVMLLETAHAAMLMHTIYYHLVINFDNPIAFSRPPWSLKLSSAFSGLVTCTAQLFFARRVSLLGGFKFKIVVGLAAVCLAAHLGESPLTIPAHPIADAENPLRLHYRYALTLMFSDNRRLTLRLREALTVVINQVGSLDDFTRDNVWLFAATLFPASLADILLAGGIIVGLLRSRETYNYWQDGLHEFLVMFVVNSGLFTGSINILPAIFAAARPKTLIWTALSFIPVRLYANTLLCVLTSRKLLSGRGLEIFGRDASARNIIARVNHLAAVEQWNVPQPPSKVPNKITINVSAETEVNMNMPAADSVQTFECSDSRVGDSFKTRGQSPWTID
ncbi:hypothetical protein VTO73DRAFT_8585 [Trametes versicolor]